MNFISQDKLTIVGAGGMIGSNMAQTAAMLRLTPNICLYDPFLQGLEGVAEEIFHCGFDGLNLSFTDNIEEALTDAKFIVSSGGAPRKDGMTREDLLKGNAEIAAQLGKDIKTYCPDAKHVVIIFNPADITGLVTLIHSGLKPNQVSTLAALDSTRLQSELAKYFKLRSEDIEGARTYGGHGEAMAVFSSNVKIKGEELDSIIGTERLPSEEWVALKKRVCQGGANIIKLRGRSSFQSPAYVSIKMIAAAMGAEVFKWPAGCFVKTAEMQNVVMGMETIIDQNGVQYTQSIKGTEEDQEALRSSYQHLIKMRDEVIKMGIIPEVEKWSELNPNL